MNEWKQHLKIAQRVQTYLQALQRTTYQEQLQRFCHVQHELSQLTSSIGMYEKALSRKWYRAAEQMRHRISRSISDLHFAFQRNQQIPAEITPLPGLSSFIADLAQIETEYGAVEYDEKDDILTVTTDPITLEDVSLGTFAIQLELSRLVDLYRDSPYKCVANEPYSASADENVTHPHVSHERLCEGDGTAAIHKALEQGRLADFFTLVIHILKTYNADSAYVRLEDWEDTSCWDCGRTVSGEDVYHCWTCHNDFCDSCSSYCARCEGTCCLGCLSQCHHCGESFCPQCMKKCKECEEVYCNECLTDNICPTCIEERENDENEQDQEQTNSDENPAEADPSVQSDSLGQAAVLSGQVQQ